MALEREVTNQLLQLPKDTTLDSLRSKPGRQDFKKLVDQLEQDFKRTVEQQKAEPPARGKAAPAHKDETSRLYRERAQASRGVGGQPHGEGTAEDIQDLIDDIEGGLADGREGGQVAGDKRGNEALEVDESGRTVDGVSTEGGKKEVEDRALRVHKLQARVSASSRRADEKRACLQLALATYQSSRDSSRDHLLESLRLMDDDRPNRVRRRLKLESAPTAERSSGSEDRVRRQVELHRDLLHLAQSHKGSLDGVVHWMLDSLKHVLECGEEFRKETFFAMLERVEDFEFSRLVSAIVVNMAQGIDVTPEELAGWLRQALGAVPPRVGELLAGGVSPARSVPASPGQLSPPSPGGRAGLFFVTEQE